MPRSSNARKLRSPRAIVGHGGRAARAAAVSVVVSGVVVSGCGVSNGLVEYVVQFTPGTSTADARAVGEDCPRFGKAFLEPPDKNHLATSRAYPVRYDITKASDQDKVALTNCLKKHKIVRGVSESNDEA